MIVVDASTLVNALTDDGPMGSAARDELGRDAHWAAPTHLPVEAFSAIRGRHLGGHVGAIRALEAISAVASASIELVPVQPLLGRMWALRDNATGYDAAYLALAEVYGCPLVTADAGLASIPGVECEVRVTGP